MSEAISNLISALLIRLRDPAGTLTGESGVDARALTIRILSSLQPIYNKAFSLSMLYVPFTIEPLLLWHDLGEVIGPSNERLTQVTHVLYQNRDLTLATLDDLKSIDRKWHRRTADRLECFIPLGYTHFILWPMLSKQDTCTLCGPLLTPAIQDENVDTLAISEQRTVLLLQLTELLMSNRANDEAACTVLLKNFTQFLPRQLLQRGAPSAA